MGAGLRGRYTPFNLKAFNQRLRHDLLVLDGATNSDHDARYVNLVGEGTNITNGTFNLTTTGLGTFGSLLVDNVSIDNNTITTASGALALTFAEGPASIDIGTSDGITLTADEAKITLNTTGADIVLITNGETVDIDNDLLVRGESVLSGFTTINADLQVDAGLTVDTTTLVVDAVNHRVGIGTDSPANMLEIYNDQDAITRFSVNNPNTGDNSGTNLRFFQGITPVADNFFDNLANIYFIRSLTAGSALRLGAAGENILSVNAGGNVGIGSVLPFYKLEVHTDKNAIAGTSIDVSELTMKFRNVADDNDEAIGIGFGLSGNPENVGAAIIHERVGSQSYGNLHFATKPSGAASGADIPIRVTIDSAGNVGIGTTTPGSKLTVFTNAWNTAETPLVNITNLDSNAVDADALLVRGGANNESSDTFEVQDFSGNTDFVVVGNGKVGIGEPSPEVRLEITSTAPYLTLHNSTEENSGGGRESRINFKGEQDGTEETTLARIEVSHDGAADDQKGKFVISVNAGSDGDTPTEELSVATGLVSVANGFKADTTTLVVDAVNHIVEIGSADGSDKIQIFHDNTDAVFATSDGLFVFKSIEAGTPDVNIRFSTGAASLIFGVSGAFNVANFNASGPIDMQLSANGDMRYFRGASSGETKEMKIYGFRAGDASRSLEIGVGTDAADTASFDGLSNYLFDGNIEAVAGFKADTTTLVVDAVTHRVGMGTDTPSTLLEVDGGASQAVSFLTDSFDPVLSFERKSGGFAGKFGFSIAGGGLNFQDITNNESLFHAIYDNYGGLGNLPILSIGPNRVNGPIAGEPALLKGHEAGTVGTDTAGGDLYIAPGLGRGDGDLAEIRFYTPNKVGTGTSEQTYSVKMIVLGTGNVGINTTSPDAKLQVVGDARFGDQATNYAQISATGVLSFAGTAGIQLPHMMQSDSTDQVVGTANVAQVVTFDTDVHHFGITRTSSSRFTILKEASYLIAISAICHTALGQARDIEIWLRMNGSDVANSNTLLHLNSNDEVILSVTFIQHFDVNDYFEFWMTGQATSVELHATPAVTTGGEERPASPSIIMTCNYSGVD